MSDSRIINLTNNRRLKRNQALRGIENCAWCWVEEGKTVRNLTLKESLQMRAEQAAVREPLAYAELPGLTFSGSVDYKSIRAAHEFCASSPVMGMVQ